MIGTLMLEEKRLAFEALAGLIERIVDPQPNVVAIWASDEVVQLPRSGE